METVDFSNILPNEHLKKRVIEAFKNVDSAEFLQEQIKVAIEKHRQNFREFQTLNPNKNFSFWKNRNEEINKNATNNNEVMAIGIFLLALDEFEKELQQYI